MNSPSWSSPSSTVRPWVLAETSYSFVKQNPYNVAVLPLGATEPHNLHLPYGTDLFEGTILGEEICGRAWAEGAKCVLLPTIPYGTETNMSEFPLAMNLNPSTISTIIEDLTESLEASGIEKLVLLNSHGGNDLKPVLRELAGRTEVQIFLCNWYAAISDVYSQIFEHPEDHAGEMETSFIMAYLPELVQRDESGQMIADQGDRRPLAFEALEKNWVSITRPWHLLTTNSGSGYPHMATAEKGRKLIEVLCDRLVPFLKDLSETPVDDFFPFEK